MLRLILGLGLIVFCAIGWGFDEPGEGRENVQVDADLLIVGGTESGCAAAVQAARMGIKHIVIVNDIEWVGGQFSAEALGAIDENRAHGYDGSVPVPRSGLFRETIDWIENENARRYAGVKRPGNTRVITTARPEVSRDAFLHLLAPYEKTGQIQRYSDFVVAKALMANERLTGVVFHSQDDPENKLTVRAPMTIDASDWGDVIKASGSAYDFGIDAKDEFGEPGAPASGDPPTDMNPITYCMIVVEQPEETRIAKPEGYDKRRFLGTWNWIEEEFAYSTRRLVDAKHFSQIEHPDVLLINNPNIDYPVDVWPAKVAAALEATEAGASKKNLVELTSNQREIVFADAKNHSLQYLYYLQSSFPKFRRLALSEEFQTADRMPPKPYIREGLRLVAKHIVKEQEVLGFGGRSYYANAMFPDALFAWQFELDFHPTARHWLSDEGAAGPWDARFRGNRRFGNGGTGRAVFPLRSLVPVKTTGLLGAQKNLGYTSIVGSSCRLHDQSMAVGQAAGAVAAIGLKRDETAGSLAFDAEAMAEIWEGLLDVENGAGLVIWPFGDVDPYDDGFAAIQHLALRRLLPLSARETSFQPDEDATAAWCQQVIERLQASGYEPVSIDIERKGSRQEFAVALWNELKKQPTPKRTWKAAGDADDDGIADVQDPLPFTPGKTLWKIEANQDGIPDAEPVLAERAERFDFTSAGATVPDGFYKDCGGLFDEKVGYGWARDLSANTRFRAVLEDSLRDGFVFTRTEDTWERSLANGKYRVTICLGDSDHEQLNQNVRIEGVSVAESVDTMAGGYHEVQVQTEITDERLTIQIGQAAGESNTTLNWVIIEPIHVDSN
ncbi:FAD dependent oxidoreductase [Roseimaritima multifibrata]|uniref:FAD dependent oxidoreductase n=1 Tax=Roseimaritima multifibrata TaxID=1930274 RepID=A0A517MHH6_9BACT|nr:FAD-dependent oxidoreductase [Roseimaritima multifibrata]QDS94340.1 FAD dependent oxidoreductase [Roseimaritima multifibrata]